MKIVIAKKNARAYQEECDRVADTKICLKYSLAVSSARMPACKFCGDAFTTAANMQKHQSLAPDCLRKVEEEFRDISRLRRERRGKATRPPFSACGNTDFGPIFEPEVELPFLGAGGFPQDQRLGAETDLHAEPVVDWDATAPTNMLELEAQDEELYTRKKVKRTEFPIKNGLKPGHAYGLGKTAFRTIQEDLIFKNREVLGPFNDDAEWELARWLIKNVGHGQVDTLLKLSIVSQHTSYIAFQLTCNISRSPNEHSPPSVIKINSWN